MSTHQTVFLQSALDFLNVKAGAWYLDATFGAGGHSRAIMEQGGKVVAYEYDQTTYQQAIETFQTEIAQNSLYLYHQNFANLSQHLSTLDFLPSASPFAGIIFDLGTSSDQLMSGTKGLSVYEDGPLDMRLDQSLAVTARDLLLVLSEKQLSDTFFNLGGELEARKIAKAIVSYRQKQGPNAFLNSQELTQLITRVKKGKSKIHPATKVFQALRIIVNDEINNLTQALPAAFKALQPNGRLVVIAFHDGEDRPVKQFFKQQVQAQAAHLLTKKPFVPDSQELENRRSRSAKMRVLEKII